MVTNFYRAFEDKFRGPRELIMSRLQVYLPFIEPLKELHPDASAVDLGCGRGEWLEVIGKLGFSAQGVDLDEDMLAACREQDLNVQATEAISFLKSLPGDSQTIVSGFHLAEHIPFSDLQDLVKEALRVLRPAGVLILETPNPENIVVGTSEFYLDPTHQRPLPPLLLSFLPEYYGFKKVKIIRLQEPTDFGGGAPASLHSVFRGVSADYAVVAQKNAKDKLINLLEKPFAANYGVTLHHLTTTFDQRLQNMDERIQLADERVESVLRDIYDSGSWRITAPLRWVLDQVELLRQHDFTLKPKAITQLGSSLLYLLLLPVRLMLTWLIDLIAKYPQLKKTLAKTLGISADLEHRLYTIFRGYGLVGGAHASGEGHEIVGQPNENSEAQENRITSSDYFNLKIDQRVCDIYGLNIDFALIRQIRQELTLPYEPFSGADLERVIAHIYLALLYRHPSAHDSGQWRKRISSSHSFDTLFSSIMEASEFESRGYRSLA